MPGPTGCYGTFGSCRWSRIDDPRWAGTRTTCPRCRVECGLVVPYKCVRRTHLVALDSAALQWGQGRNRPVAMRSLLRSVVSLC